MHVDWAIVLFATLVGFTVGLTGMGGGALMTPVLLIFFHVLPTAAVSSDLVAAMVMKPVGGGVHIRRRTVRWELVKPLCIGSIPAAFAGVFLLRAAGEEPIQSITKVLLGVTLLLAAAAMVLRAWLQGRRNSVSSSKGRGNDRSRTPIRVRIAPTILVGAIGGLIVGLTSVGSGSIIIVCLMLLYPELRGAELVGTDLVQAIPLVSSAALAHILVGDFELGLTVSILLGALPAVYVGARLSARAPDWLIRPVLVVMLFSSALKLLDVPTATLGLLLLAFALLALPMWGATDAASHAVSTWESLGRSRSNWIKLQAWLAPVGIGFGVAIAYFAWTRPQLVQVARDAALA
jgi:hypothetical protein